MPIKIRSSLFLLLLVPVMTSLVFAQDAPSDNNIQYHWAFVARAGDTGNRHIGIITKDTSLNTGDEFKLFVNLVKPSFVYVIHKSPANELSLLFPYDTAMFQKDCKLDKNYYIPKGREWFKLDKNTGTETFYVLASSERLTDLENDLRAYFKSAEEKKSDAAAFVVNEIKDIKKRFRTFSTFAERPITIAGNVRGEKQAAVDLDRVDIAVLASEILANNFFSKTISIDHK
ncbi:MAG: DUF4384 domain-containing protein [Bacteroidota bacterium]